MSVPVLPVEGASNAHTMTLASMGGLVQDMEKVQPNSAKILFLPLSTEGP